jgi:hypothetical protein
MTILMVHLLLLLLDTGWIKIGPGIRDKHPGYATLSRYKKSWSPGLNHVIRTPQQKLYAKYHK